MITGPVRLPLSSVVSNSTKSVTVPGDSVLHPIGIFDVAGVTKVLLIGTVGGTGPLTDLAVGLSASGSDASDGNVGKTVIELSGTGGDFATPAGILNRATTTPHTTVSGHSFRLALDLEGIASTLTIFAASAVGATLAIDASATHN